MVLRLRLARVPHPLGARRHRPFYNIILAQARMARDAKPMEVLGTYNPIPQAPPGADSHDADVRKIKEIKVDVARAKYWLGVGAQPTDTVWRLLSMIGLVEPKFLSGRAGQERDKKGALRGVRFETHIPVVGAKESRSRDDQKEGSKRMAENEVRAHLEADLGADLEASSSQKSGKVEELGEKDARASTTSPVDPNTA